MEIAYITRISASVGLPFYSDNHPAWQWLQSNIAKIN
jgi:hypothetical protein